MSKIQCSDCLKSYSPGYIKRHVCRMLVDEQSLKTLSLCQSLRRATPAAAKVFAVHGRDLYTGQTDLSKILRPQVDHVLELQVVARALVLEFGEFVTAGLVEMICPCLEVPENFNVTSQTMNLRKRDAVSRALKGGDKRLSELLFAAFTERQAVAISSAIERALEAVCAAMLTRSDKVAGCLKLHRVVERLKGMKL